MIQDTTFADVNAGTAVKSGGKTTVSDRSEGEQRKKRRRDAEGQQQQMRRLRRNGNRSNGYARQRQAARQRPRPRSEPSGPDKILAPGSIQLVPASWLSSEDGLQKALEATVGPLLDHSEALAQELHRAVLGRLRADQWAHKLGLLNRELIERNDALRAESIGLHEEVEALKRTLRQEGIRGY